MRTLTKSNREQVDAARQEWNVRNGCCTLCGGRNYGTAYNAGNDYTPPERWFFCATCHPNIAALASVIQRELRDRRERLWGFQYRRRLARDYFPANIGAAYSHCWFRTYCPCNGSQTIAADQVAKWAQSATARLRVPFVLLVGEPGVGKTHLAVSAWRHLARSRELPAAALPGFVDETRLNLIWRESHRAYERRGGESPDEVVQLVASLPVLIWDDLGKAKQTDAWFQLMFGVINYRMANRLPTLFTSNYAADELSQRIEPSLVDRIASGKILTVEGPSMRGAPSMAH